MLRRKACFGFLFMLWIWVWVTTKAQAESGSSLNNIKVCVSFDKSHMSFFNIGWDGSEIGVEIIYNATGRNKTSVQYTSHTRMITSLRITDGSIGSNVTVQVGPLVSNGSQHNNNLSDPITLVVNYVNDVKWTRISTNHIQFNCTLACRSAINYCSVELNGTKNSSFAINKRDFSSWAIVDFVLLDAHQTFTYAVYAEGSSNRVLGQRINGSIPPILLSTNPPNTTSIMTAPDQVLGVMVITNSITLNDDNVTLTLSWDEPFNNYDPIVNYIVSCSGDVTCPPNFTTTDNTTRSYTITNLTPMTDYTFSVVATNSIGSGEAGVMTVSTPSGTPDRVPYVMIIENSVKINGSNVTLTLRWGEPFSYFDPIINYTVSCLGDVTNFTTTDSTTRSYTITNLTPMTNYTFSVVATNSFGSGEADLLVNTTPGISQVIVNMLRCDIVNIINQCTITWSWISLQENIINFLVISNVGTFNVTSQDASHRFNVLSLPGGAQSGEVTVIVIVVNELGQGPPSEVARANITVPSVIDATPMLVFTPAVSELYNVTVTCTIHPDSTADQCVVMAMADGIMTRTGNASITEGMATVAINDLQCGLTYNITAEGMLDETLVGSRSTHGSIAPRPCPMTSNESDDELSTGAAVAIGVVITLIITLVVTALISIFMTSLYYKYRYELKEKVTVDDDNTKQKDPYSDNITMDTNPAYGTTTTIKMDTNPAYATTSH